MNFTFFNPTRILFGQGRIASISEYIPEDAKVLVVYGGGSIKKNGVYDQVAAALAGRSWVEFSGVEPNPTVETLRKAVALAKAENAGFVLAVGGGSVSDGSKFIAAAALYDGDGWDILTGAYKVERALPVGVVLTLPATGSESNFRAVVTRAETKDKLPFYAPAVQPRFAVLDPDVIKSLPERQVANGIADAFVHVCEQYLTYPAGGMVQDGYAEGLLRTLTFLAGHFDERDDAWRANLMYAANQGLNDLIACGVPQDWSTHRIGHELTALYGIDHARTLTAIQPTLLRMRIDAKREKLESMGRRVFELPDGPDLAERTVDAMEAMYKALGLPVTMSEAGVPSEGAVETILGQMEKHGMTALGERRDITLETSREILTRAL